MIISEFNWKVSGKHEVKTYFNLWSTFCSILGWCAEWVVQDVCGLLESTIKYKISEKLVCYWFKQMDSNLINPNLCTHIIYSFLGLDSQGNLTYADLTKSRALGKRIAKKNWKKKANNYILRLHKSTHQIAIKKYKSENSCFCWRR